MREKIDHSRIRHLVGAGRTITFSVDRRLGFHFDDRTLNGSRLATVLLLAIAPLTAPAQWSNDLFTNASYWGDGRAEVNLYDAQLMRETQLRKGEVLVIVQSERVDPTTLVRVDDPKRADAAGAIRMSLIWTLPLGLVVEQASQVALWRTDGSLARLSLVGTDSNGNFLRKIEERNHSLTFTSESYRAVAAPSPVAAPSGNSLFADELPWRVRTIDFRKPPGEFEVQLASPLAGTTGVEFKPARISWRPSERRLEVTVRHAAGTDLFSLDQRFPYLVREWHLADGSILKLKRDFKVDYWNYKQNGDRERAFKNPMLGHPD